METTLNASTHAPLSRKELLLVVGLLVVVSILALPGMSAPLLLDDLDQLSHVRRFTKWTEVFGPDSFGLFRPVKNLIYYFLGGIPLGAWHLLNFVMYLLSGVAVYGLMRSILGGVKWALVVTALWMTCPTQVSTAVWMSCVNISLSVIFTCGCLWLHDRNRGEGKTGWLRMGGVALLMFLAECSYETAVAVPVLCVLLDRYRSRKVFSREALLCYVLYGVTTLAFLWMRQLLGGVESVKSANLGFSPDLQAWQLAVSAPWFLWRHLSMWLLPAGRLEFCSTYLWGVSASPVELAASWVLLLGLIGLAVYLFRRQPWVGMGFAWFLVVCFPSSNLVPTYAGPVEDYYVVFPGIGLAWALAGVLRGLLEWTKQTERDERGMRRVYGKILLGGVVVWRGLCLPLFFYQAMLWQDPLKLYVSLAESRSNQFQLQSLAARELMLRGQSEVAAELAKDAQKQAPWYPLSAMILGKISLEARDWAATEMYFREAMKRTQMYSPVYDYSRLMLAQSYLEVPEKRGEMKELLMPYLTTINHPQHLSAIELQVESYLREDKGSDALRAARKGYELHPDQPRMVNLLKKVEAKYPNAGAPIR